MSLAFKIQIVPAVLLGSISVCLLSKMPSPGKKDGGRYISTKGCKK
jgi:hypothetical protein